MRSDLTKVRSLDSAISYFSPKFFSTTSVFFQHDFRQKRRKASLQAFTAPQHYQRAEKHLKKEKKKKTVKIDKKKASREHSFRKETVSIDFTTLAKFKGLTPFDGFISSMWIKHLTFQNECRKFD